MKSRICIFTLLIFLISCESPSENSEMVENTDEDYTPRIVMYENARLLDSNTLQKNYYDLIKMTLKGSKYFIYKHSYSEFYDEYSKEWVGGSTINIDTQMEFNITDGGDTLRAKWTKDLNNPDASFSENLLLVDSLDIETNENEYRIYKYLLPNPNVDGSLVVFYSREYGLIDQYNISSGKRFTAFDLIEPNREEVKSLFDSLSSHREIYLNLESPFF